MPGVGLQEVEGLVKLSVGQGGLLLDGLGHLVGEVQYLCPRIFGTSHFAGNMTNLADKNAWFIIILETKLSKMSWKNKYFLSFTNTSKVDHRNLKHQQ